MMKLKALRALVVMALLNIWHLGYADNIKMPPGCEKLKFNDEKMILTLAPAKKSVGIYVLYNSNDNDIYLSGADDKTEHLFEKPFNLKSKTFSSIMIKEMSLTFNCLEIKRSQEQLMSCSEDIIACHLGKFKVSSNREDTYWLSQNKRELTDIYEDLKFFGVRLA